MLEEQVYFNYLIFISAKAHLIQRYTIGEVKNIVVLINIAVTAVGIWRIIAVHITEFVSWDKFYDAAEFKAFKTIGDLQVFNGAGFDTLRLRDTGNKQAKYYCTD